MSISSFLQSSSTQSDFTSLFPSSSARFRVPLSSRERVQDIVAKVLFCTGTATFFRMLPWTRFAWKHLPPMSSWVTAPLALVAIQAILAVSCLYTVRKVLAIIAGFAFHPIGIVSRRENANGTTEFYRQGMFQRLQEQGHFFKRVALEKGGVSYDAFIVGKKETLQNGKWVLYSPGNMESAESTLYTSSLEQRWKTSAEPFQANLLYVNPPRAGSSGGLPLTSCMSDAVEAGMLFLEKEIRATRTLLWGWSLGGGAIGKAVTEHDFTGVRPSETYAVLSDRSFSNLSAAASCLAFRLAGPLLRLLGAELDSLAAARRLQSLGVRHLVVEGGEVSSQGQLCYDGDEVIWREASLGWGLQRAGLSNAPNLFPVLEAGVMHSGPLSSVTQRAIQERLASFFTL